MLLDTEPPVSQSWGLAVAVWWSLELLMFPSDVLCRLVSCSRGRKAACASTSCRMYRLPWTFSSTDRWVKHHKGIIFDFVVSIFLISWCFYYCFFVFVSNQENTNSVNKIVNTYHCSFQVKLVNIRNDDIADGKLSIRTHSAYFAHIFP